MEEKKALEWMINKKKKINFCKKFVQWPRIVLSL